MAEAKILVLRFSAMGDVAMIVPVLKAFNTHYPDTKLLVVSRNFFKPFFSGIKNLEFVALDDKNKHKGILGLIKLFIELKKYNITALADLHYNLRSRIICLLFSLCGTKIKHINKDRAKKKALTATQHKVFIPLKSTLQRYVEVFSKLGFPFALDQQLTPEKNILTPEIINITGEKNNQKWVGISPFAQHLQKVYPLIKMETVVLQLANKGYKLLIFGGSAEEQNIAQHWASKHPQIISVVKKLNLTQELDLISCLDVMLSMDSAGMHMASLKGIPVVSVWGATHPYAGFLGYGQSLENAVQIDLPCRPCSVYGNKPCHRGDFACMQNLPENLIVDKVDKLLINVK